MDEYTEMRFVYFMKGKGDAAAAFRRFCADVRQYGEVRRIRTDNGGEYTAAAFRKVEEENMVAHEWAAPRTPQQVGKAERSWLTLKDMARAAVMHAELPLAAWERAVATAAYVVNRLPTAASPRSACTKS